MTTEPDAEPSQAALTEDLRLRQDELEAQLEEPRRAEAQISALSDRYRTLFARAPVATLTVDDDGVVLQANDTARMLLTAGEPLDGKPLLLHVVPTDHATLRRLVRHRDASARRTDAVFRNRLGTRIPCHVTSIHLSGLQDEADTVLLSLEDRREHDRLATVLSEAERSKAIRQLTGGIGHDFNNLLTVIVGNLSLLEDEVDGDDGRQWLTAARTAGDRGGRLVAQLLTYTRSQSLVAQPCEVAPLLQEMLPLLDSAVGESVEIVLDVPTDLPRIEVDPTQLQTSLLNVAINSRDAGASVFTVHAEPTARGEALLEVRDDGHGMAMVASFVQASHGDLEIQTAPGSGTTISLTLPAVRDDLGSPVGPGATAGVDLAGRRILVVEDQPAVREVTGALLGARGAIVTAVADAETALARLTDQRVDLVLSDVVLGPGMDGLTLRRRLAADPSSPPVVLTSGHGHGRADVLAKPFTTTQLLAALGAALAGNGGPA